MRPRLSGPLGLKHVVLPAIAIALALIAAQQLMPQAGHPNVVELYTPDLEPLLKGKVLVVWHQEECFGCKIAEPAVFRLAEERPDITVVRVHLDEALKIDPGLLARYRVYVTPTFVLYQDGVEVARHAGLFLGDDQYPPLRDFVDGNLPPDAGPNNYGPPLALALGLLAAFSPCSVPLLAAFSAKGSKRFFRALASVLSASLLAGLAFSAMKLWASGLFFPVQAFLTSFVLVWGIWNLAGREIALPASPLVLPVLGLQCSLPFLLLALSTIGGNPMDGLIMALLFSAGYSLPYAFASPLLGKVLKRPEKLLRFQGAFLLAASILILYEIL